MDGFLRRLEVMRSPHNEEASPFDLMLRERARLCRAAASSTTAPDELTRLSRHEDEAVRVSVFANSAFRDRATERAHAELARPEATWMTTQAIAASPYVGAAALWLVFGVRNGEHGQRSLATLLPLVNNLEVPRALLATIVAERAHEHFSDEDGDRNRPTHLHHAHLRRAYKAVWEIAARRLASE